MPFTTVDPRTALVVIDLQRGITATPLAHPAADVVERSAALAADFRASDLPVVLVTVAGTPAGRTDAGPVDLSGRPDDWTELVIDADPRDVLVTKYTRSAFPNTGLLDRLRELDVTQLVVTGIATSGGVESTARDAHELGFHVSLPLDAMTDRSVAAHEHSATQIFPRIAETGTTEQLRELIRR